MRGRKKGFAAEQESERARAPCKVDSRGEEEEEFHTFDSKQDLWRQEQPRKRKGKTLAGVLQISRSGSRVFAKFLVSFTCCQWFRLAQRFRRNSGVAQRRNDEKDCCFTEEAAEGRGQTDGQRDEYCGNHTKCGRTLRQIQRGHGRSEHGRKEGRRRRLE